MSRPFRRTRCLEALCAGCVVLLCAAVWSSETPAPPLHGIIGTDDRILVDASQWPWQAIGLVHRKVGGACTGTLIQSKVVLTAAHCTFDQRTGRALQASEIRFQVTNDARKPPASSLGAGIVRTASWHGQRAPNIEDMASDWALVILRKPLAVRPIPLKPLQHAAGARADVTKMSVSRAGYSEDGKGKLMLDPSCRILHRDPKDRFLFTDCDTLKGDSGSPLLHGAGQAISVIGVTSGLITADNGRTGSVVVHADSILKKTSTLKIPGTQRPVLDPVP